MKGKLHDDMAVLNALGCVPGGGHDGVRLDDDAMNSEVRSLSVRAGEAEQRVGAMSAPVEVEPSLHGVDGGA